jgi:hypothetical protein
VIPKEGTVRSAALALALLVATGCTTYLGRPDQWKRPAVSMQQLTFDDYRCDEASAAAWATPDLFVGGVVDAVRVWVDQWFVRNAYVSCMTKLGYRRS